jgi:serine/threonine protein kinase
MAAEHIIAERYEVIALIDEGGMGQVFRGRDLQTGETIAIKALKEEVVEQDSTLVDRFCREAVVLRKLNHPNIVRVYDTFEEEGRHYIIMEYIPGGSLAQLIRQHGPLPIERAVQIALDLADALTRTHRLQVIHRDLKPANVLLAEDGTPRLTDFGVAHDSAMQTTMLTQVGALVGTIAYLSPEVSEGMAHNEKSDIWSFGLVLYEMLTGRRAFNEQTPANMLNAILRKPIPDLRALRLDIPEDLAALVDRMLAKDPEKRIATAREVGVELERILQRLRQSAAATGEQPAVPGVSRFATTPMAAIPAVPQQTVDTTIGSPTQVPLRTASLTPQPGAPQPPGSVPLRPRTVTNPRLFIAYRREDSGEIAGRLYEQLADMIGESGIVRDVDRVADRTVSRYVLANDVVGSVDVILVLIGPGWVGMPRDRRAVLSERAIDNPKDSVRMQIEAGLRRGDILIIPVLVNGGVLPEVLPASLEGLRDRTPFIITPDQPLDAQVKKLVRLINEHFGLNKPPRSPFALLALVVFVLLVLLAIGSIVALAGGFPTG